MRGSSKYTITALLGLSIPSLFVLLLSRKNRRQMPTEKLNIIRDAVVQADRRLDSLLERHDALLSQVCSQGLFCNRELHHTLLDARKAVLQASEFAAALRRLQMDVLANFPHPPPAPAPNLL